MATTELDESGQVAEQFSDVQAALEALRSSDKGLAILAIAVRGNAIYVDSARGGPHADLGLLMHGLELCMASLGVAVTVVPMPVPPPGAGAAGESMPLPARRAQVNVEGIGKATLLKP